MKTFVMKNCGCRLKRNDLMVVKSSGYRCRHHPKNTVEFVEINCCDCGNKIIASPKATSIIRCKSCKTTRRKELQKIADLKRRNPNYKKIFESQQKREKASQESWDCINRSHCLTDAIETNCKYLPCLNCSRYVPMVAA